MSGGTALADEPLSSRACDWCGALGSEVRLFEIESHETVLCEGCLGELIDRSQRGVDPPAAA